MATATPTMTLVRMRLAPEPGEQHLYLSPGAETVAVGWVNGAPALYVLLPAISLDEPVTQIFDLVEPGMTFERKDRDFLGMASSGSYELAVFERRVEKESSS